MIRSKKWKDLLAKEIFSVGIIRFGEGHAPPWMSLVDREEVPEEKSSRSTRPTRSPRVAASSAAPHPVAPPPTTSTSRGPAGVDPASAASCASRGGGAAPCCATRCRAASRAAAEGSEAEAEEAAKATATAEDAARAAPARRRRHAAMAAPGRPDAWVYFVRLGSRAEVGRKGSRALALSADLPER